MRKLTKEQEQQLLEHYLAHGAKATEAMCDEMGVSRRYPASVASIYGKSRLRSRSTKYKRIPEKWRPNDSHDHRWAWAIARGAISI